MNMLDMLKKQQDFTDSEIHIAEFILEHLDETIDMSIGQLAANTFSSNSTIIRLCRKLGTDGFKEFKIKLIKDREKQNQEKSDINYNKPFVSHESPASIMATVAAMEKNAIDASYAAISSKTLAKAASWLSSARNVYLIAVGDSMLTTMAFSYMLQKIGINPILVTQYNDSISVIYGANSEDVALFVSYSGATPHFRVEQRYFRTCRCKSILITSKQDAANFDLVISFPALEHLDGKVTGYYSQTAIRYVLNCLYSIIFSQDLENYSEHRYEADRLGSGAYYTNE